MKQPAVYIVTNTHHTVIYTGVTSNLAKRAYEHKHSLVDGFTKKYNCTKLVYYDACDTMEQAILREKQIKGWIRLRKNALISSMNPEWVDLYNTLAGSSF
jgi:putative endonuclease